MLLVVLWPPLLLLHSSIATTVASHDVAVGDELSIEKARSRQLRRVMRLLDGASGGSMAALLLLHSSIAQRLQTQMPHVAVGDELSK